jgi:hypothetical protein
VHAGGTLLVELGPAFAFGGIAALLSDGGESATHLLTAGHLFPAGAVGAPVLSARSPGEPPRPIGTLGVNLLDGPAPSLGFALDLALVTLNADGQELASEVDPRAPLPSLIAASATLDTRKGQPYRPTLNDYGSSTSCSLGPSVFHIVAAPFRPTPYEVNDVIVGEHVVTAEGDSGTILLDADDHRVALGSCIGIDGRFSTFEPIERGLSILSDDHKIDLQLWSP